MPRTSKAEQKKQEKGMEFLLALLGDTGQTVEEEQVKKAFEPPVKHHDYKMLQAEGVLLHLQVAQRTMQHKYCKRCGEVFSTRYMSVAYCSDLCRKMEMEAIGIRWDPRTDSYANMDAERPIVVGPQAHSVLLQAAKRFVEDQNVLVEESRDSPKTPDPLHQIGVPELAWDDDEQVHPEETIVSDDLPTSPELSLPPSTDLSIDFPESPFLS